MPPGKRLVLMACATATCYPPEMFKRWVRRPGVQGVLASCLAAYLDFALRSTRWRVQGEANLAPFANGAPAVAAFWHERLPLMPALWQAARRQGAGIKGHVLVSRHNDGQLIGAVMRHFGVGVVLGSSSRGGAVGSLALLDALAAGGIAIITPDGPRGPPRRAAPGVAQLAAISGAPVLPCAAQTSRRWVLRTWDRMVLPLPFGRGVLVCLPAIAVPREGWEASLPGIAAALSEAADIADRMVG